MAVKLVAAEAVVPGRSTEEAARSIADGEIGGTSLGHGSGGTGIRLRL